MDRLFRSHLAPGKLDRPVRDDLVHVHVRLRSGAGLPYAQRKMRIELTGDHFVGCGNDQPRVFFVELTEVVIDRRRGLFEQRHRPDDLLWHNVSRPRAVPDVEMHERARRLGAVILVGRNFDLPH